MSVEYTTKKASNEKDERQWSELPFEALKTIYSFLSRSDQFNMSMVCSSWLKVYDDPCLWKSFALDYKGSCNGRRFGWKYSSSFQHVKINCKVPSNRPSWCRQLKAFLHHITSNSQLTSVIFEGFLWSSLHTDDLIRTDVNRAIGDFLGSQHHLQKLEFDGFFLKFGDCVELLKHLNENSKDTMLHLCLKGLEICESLEEEDQDLNAALNLFSFAGLEGITALYITYSLIFEKALNCFDIKSPQNSAKLALSIITFYYDNNDIHVEYYEGLKSIDWAFLKELYPHLQVQSIIMTDSPSRLEVETLIAPEIPITRLDYTYEDSYNHSSCMDIDELFNHLASKTSKDLVSLNLAWNKKVSNFDANLISLLQACKKLKSLEIVIVAPVNGLSFLLESFLEKRPESLKEVSIFIAGMNEEEYRTILTDSTEYLSRLHAIGLNVKIYLQGGC